LLGTELELVVTGQQCEVRTAVPDVLIVDPHDHDRQAGRSLTGSAQDADLLLGQRRAFIHLDRARPESTAAGEDSRHDETATIELPGRHSAISHAVSLHSLLSEDMFDA